MPTTSSGFATNREWLRYCWLALAAFALLVPSCQEATHRVPDGETHFLRACAPESSDCGPELTCVCGACLPPCSQAADCTELNALAECVLSTDRIGGIECDAPPAGSYCDVPCVTDADCRAQSSGSLCSEGYCRACPHGDVAANEVVVLGDVFIAQTHEVTAELESLARDAGALGPADGYRDYSSMTENALALGDALLVDRYNQALAEGPVRVVIMNGGGSDMLLGSCDGTPAVDCPLIVDTVAAAEQLLAQMAADGVEQVLWFYYPDPADAVLLTKLEILHPLLRAACEGSATSCHWLDLREAFDGHFSEYMETDFVPTSLGAEVAAAAIWTQMEENCIAQ